MAAQKYITSVCSISNNQVHVNGLPVFAAADLAIDEFLPAVYQHLQPGYAKFYKMDNLSKLGFLAAEVLLKNKLTPGYYQPEQVGTVLVNANSSLDMDLKYQASIKEVPSPSLFVYTLPNIVAGEICIRHHFKGENAFFVAPVFDANFIAGQVNYLLDHNILQACICGWVDVLEQDYNAVLYLVEKVKKENAVEFTAKGLTLPSPKERV